MVGIRQWLEFGPLPAPVSTCNSIYNIDTTLSNSQHASVIILQPNPTTDHGQSVILLLLRCIKIAQLVGGLVSILRSNSKMHASEECYL